MMFEYLTHCYNRVPFRSISGLSKSEAVKVMEDLCDDSPFFERFKEPLKYWEERQEAEAWLRAEFIKKGGKPKGYYPYYCILGPASWIEQYAASNGIFIDMLQMPLSIFNENDISFTVPDSMVSFWIGRDKPLELYQSGIHGEVFTLTEIRSIVTPELMIKLESLQSIGTIPYVEIQIWNHEVAKNYFNSSN